MKQVKTCDCCGQEFATARASQHYCRRVIIRKCLLCGEMFDTKCSPDAKLTCSKPECRKQSNQVSNPVERECKACGETFTTIFYKQMYCKQPKQKTCPTCGEVIEYICGPDVSATCGNTSCQAAYIKQSREESASQLTRICKWCGKEFHPKDWRDSYCSDKHYKTCTICGREFEVDVRKDQLVETCSKECKGKLMSQNHDYSKGYESQRKKMLQKYGVENPFQFPEFREKAKKTNLEKYGSEHYTQTAEYRERAKKTNLERYGTEWYLGSQDAKDKRAATNLEKYGVENPFQSEEVKQKIRKSMLEKYGAEHTMQVPEIAKKAIRNSRKSSLEVRVCNLLDNYCIEYIHQYFVKQNGQSHLFDFYLPDYKLLVDADGVYYHAYLDDPDGERVRDDYDEVRLSLIPEDHRFYLIVEGQEDKQMKDLISMLESIHGSLSQFDSILFEWCRSIDFPYPEYTDKRMQSDFNKLCRYEKDEYIPQCRFGQSILKNFHKSIYHARVGNFATPYEGWNDDNKLRQVIRNRFIYKNTVDPSKVLAGFNVSKIAPCVSTFNPVLTRYLIKKYLSEFNAVFDPFSGFSGRLIGTASTGKGYIGYDLNEIAVSESNDVINFLQLDRSKYSVQQQDILTYQGTFECLLTCPPYYRKERYNSESVFKECDDWIDECLTRFECKRYVFVVDSTEKYSDNVVETIESASHLSKSTEYVIVI